MLLFTTVAKSSALHCVLGFNEDHGQGDAYRLKNNNNTLSELSLLTVAKGFQVKVSFACVRHEGKPQTLGFPARNEQSRKLNAFPNEPIFSLAKNVLLT